MEEVREGHFPDISRQHSCDDKAINFTFLDGRFVSGLWYISIFLCEDFSLWLGTRRGGVLGYSVFHCIFGWLVHNRLDVSDMLYMYIFK